MIPCTHVLSVPGFLLVTGLFPVGLGFIPEVVSQRPGRPVLTFLTFLFGMLSYVAGIHIYQLYEDQAARRRGITQQ